MTVHPRLARLAVVLLALGLVGACGGSSDKAAPTTTRATTTTILTLASLSDAEQVWCNERANMPAVYKALISLAVPAIVTVATSDFNYPEGYRDAQGHALHFNVNAWVAAVRLATVDHFPDITVPADDNLAFLQLQQLSTLFGESSGSLRFWARDDVARGCRAAYQGR